MINTENIFDSSNIQKYLNEMDTLIKTLLHVPLAINNSHLDSFEQFDSLIVSSTDRKIPLYFDRGRSRSSSYTVTDYLQGAQQGMLRLATKFKENNLQYRVEQPDVFLPFANLPAAQNIEYLTPDNYARQVRSLLHAIFRRLLPGSKFRSRGNGVLLKLDGNMIKRAYTFSDFMQQDDFWTNFLSEHYPECVPAVQKFREAKDDMTRMAFSQISVRHENTREDGQSEAIHIYVPLPKPEHCLSETIDTPEGKLSYIHPQLISDLNRLIVILTRVSSAAMVLSNAYPLFNRHMRTHCEELNETQRSQHKLAHDAFLQELAAREVTLSVEQIQELSPILRKALALEDATEEQTIFLPFTRRGFVSNFPHHIFIVEKESPMNKDWTPIPPSAFDETKDRFQYLSTEYSYKGVSSQTGYSDTSPRSGNGASPLIFGELVYTALHESMYNDLLATTIERLPLSQSSKERIITSARLMDDSDVANAFHELVMTLLFAETAPTEIPSFFQPISSATPEPAPEEEAAVEEEAPQEAASEELTISLERLVITKRRMNLPVDTSLDTLIYNFTQPYTLGTDRLNFTHHVSLEHGIASLNQAFTRFRQFVQEQRTSAESPNARRLMEVLYESIEEPDIRYVTTDNFEMGETAYV